MYTTPKKPAEILLIEDNPADQRATKRAFERSKLDNRLTIVENGQDALDYLHRTGAFAPPAEAPRPDLIFLDLNLPKIDGRQVLTQIKNDPDLRVIPVVVLTTSSAEDDVMRSYRLGVNSFVTKPVEAKDFVQTLLDLENYWLRIVMLPPNHHR
jgi:CheY-like chemotaxis protein